MKEINVKELRLLWLVIDEKARKERGKLLRVNEEDKNSVAYSMLCEDVENLENVRSKIGLIYRDSQKTEDARVKTIQNDNNKS